MAVKHPDMLQDQQQSSDMNTNKLQILMRYLRTHNGPNGSLEQFCDAVVNCLAQEPLPNGTEAVKMFNETLQTLQDQLKEMCEVQNSNDGRMIINECLKCLYTLMVDLTPGSPKPSGAASIVLSLFNRQHIPDAVRWMTTTTTTDEAMLRVFNILANWLATITCSPNISLWMIEIVDSLFKEKRFNLLLKITTMNLLRLMIIVQIPVFSVQVLPVVHKLLFWERTNPRLFHEYVPRLPEVMKSFEKKAITGPHPQNRLTDQEILFLTFVKVFIIHFYVNDDRYKEIETWLKYFDSKYELNVLASDQQLLLLQGQETARSDNNNPRVGLVNLGNTCYMNSVLQALVMTKQFSREFLMRSTAERNDPTHDSELVLIVQRLLAQLLHSKRPELTPREVLHATRPPGFLPGLQQDSSEFLGHLLETLHEQEAKRPKCSAAPDGTDYEMEWTDEVDDEEEDTGGDGGKETRSKLTLIQSSFGGSLAITYQCLNCGERSTNEDTFREIPLAFPDDADDQTPFHVQRLLDFYCSSEKLEGENKYHCEKCVKLVDGLRSIAIMEPPRNLILTLKHFKYDQQSHSRAKLMHNVVHDEAITLKVVTSRKKAEEKKNKQQKPAGASSSAPTQIMNCEGTASASCPSSNSEKTYKYQLYAAVVHSGMNLDAGHYWTLASDQPNSWFQFNDNFVSRSSIADLHQLKPPQTPYILFYRRDDDEEEEEDEDSAHRFVEKQEIAALPRLEELPAHLREFVMKDNRSYCLEIRRDTVTSSGGTKRFHRDNDDEEPPPPPSGCGENAVDHFNSYIC